MPSQLIPSGDLVTDDVMTDDDVNIHVTEDSHGDEQREELDRLLAFLEKGCYLTKIRGSNKTYRRYFFMDDKQRILHQRQEGGDKSTPKVMVSDLKDIREGLVSQTFIKANKKKRLKEDCCFTLVIGSEHDTLDLVADQPEHCLAWVEGLRYLRRRFTQAGLISKQELWMKEMFDKADKNKDGTLTLKEILDLLKKLNIQCSLDQAKSTFQLADTDKTKKQKRRRSSGRK